MKCLRLNHFRLKHEEVVRRMRKGLVEFMVVPGAGIEPARGVSLEGF